MMTETINKQDVTLLQYILGLWNCLWMQILKSCLALTMTLTTMPIVMTMMTLTINQKPDDTMQCDGYKSSKDDNDDTNNQTRMMQCNMMDTNS